MTTPVKQYYCEDCHCCGEHVAGTYCENVGAQPDGMCKSKDPPHPLMHEYLDVAKSATIYGVIMAFAISLPARLVMHYYSKRRE